MVPVLEEPLPKTIECLGVLGALEARVAGKEEFKLFPGLPIGGGGLRGVRGFRGGVRGFLGFWRHDEQVGMGAEG